MNEKQSKQKNNKMTDLNLIISIINMKCKATRQIKREMMRFEKKLKNQLYAICKKNT